MSDALTDIARDERRNRNVYSWIFAVADFLEGKVELDCVESAALKCDAVPRGYWGSVTAMAEHTPTVKAAGESDRDAIEVLRQLIDPEHWAATRYLAALKGKEQSDGG